MRKLILRNLVQVRCPLNPLRHIHVDMLCHEAILRLLAVSHLVPPLFALEFPRFYEELLHSHEQLKMRHADGCLCCIDVGPVIYHNMSAIIAKHLRGAGDRVLLHRRWIHALS